MTEYETLKAIFDRENVIYTEETYGPDNEPELILNIGISFQFDDKGQLADVGNLRFWERT